MEEKKKRVRPTVAQVRALQDELEQMSAVLDMECESTRRWERKFDEMSALRAKAEEDLERSREECRKLKEIVKNIGEENRALKGRRLLARILNK